jgi:hypothetical protein
MDPRDSGRAALPEAAGLWDVLNRERPFDARLFQVLCGFLSAVYLLMAILRAGAACAVRAGLALRRSHRARSGTHSGGSSAVLVTPASRTPCLEEPRQRSHRARRDLVQDDQRPVLPGDVLERARPALRVLPVALQLFTARRCSRVAGCRTASRPGSRLGRWSRRRRTAEEALRREVTSASCAT